MRERRTLVGVTEDELAGLEFPARQFNMISALRAEVVAAWRKAQDVVHLAHPDPRERDDASPRLQRRHPSIRKAAVAFNRWAKQIPTRLVIDLIGMRNGEVVVKANARAKGGEEAFALWWLWRFFFQNEVWKRLKQCPQCGKWFVDKTRNRSRLRCSASCTNRWWTVGRRQGAGHRFKKRRRRKRTANPLA